MASQLSKTKEYWRTKTGDSLDIDEMDENHVKNCLKMVLRLLSNNLEKEQVIAYTSGQGLIILSKRKSHMPDALDDLFCGMSDAAFDSIESQATSEQGELQDLAHEFDTNDWTNNLTKPSLYLTGDGAAEYEKLLGDAIDQKIDERIQHVYRSRGGSV